MAAINHLVLLNRGVVKHGGRWILRHLNTSVANRKIFDVIKEEEFKEKVLLAGNPVIVDFHAGWCQPCRVLAPRLQEVMEEFDGQVDLAKVDIDLLPDLALSNNVTSIPAVQAFVGGAKKTGFVGVQDKQFLTDFVKKLTKDQ